MAHIHYLHGDSFGNKNKPVIHGMGDFAKQDSYSVRGHFRWARGAQGTGRGGGGLLLVRAACPENPEP